MAWGASYIQTLIRLIRRTKIYQLALESIHWSMDSVMKKKTGFERLTAIVFLRVGRA